MPEPNIVKNNPLRWDINISNYNKTNCNPLCKACYLKEASAEKLQKMKEELSTNLAVIEDKLNNLPIEYSNRGSLFLAVKAYQLNIEKNTISEEYTEKVEYINKCIKRELSRLHRIDYARPISQRELDSNPRIKKWYEEKLKKGF